jgi:hypothetical protein
MHDAPPQEVLSFCFKAGTLQGSTNIPKSP